MCSNNGTFSKILTKVKTYFLQISTNLMSFSIPSSCKNWMPLSHISFSGSWEHCVLGPAARFLAGIKNTKRKK